MSSPARSKSKAPNRRHEDSVRMGLEDELPPLPPAPRLSIMEQCTNCGTTCPHIPGTDLTSGYSCSECGWTILSKYQPPPAALSKEALRIFSSGRSAVPTTKPFPTEYAADHLQAVLARRDPFSSEFVKPPIGGMSMQGLDAVQRARHAAMQRRESDELCRSLARAGFSIQPRVVQRALNLPSDRPDEECRIALTSRPWSGADGNYKASRRRSHSARASRSTRGESPPPSVASRAGAGAVTKPLAVHAQPRREPLSMARPLQATTESANAPGRHLYAIGSRKPLFGLDAQAEATDKELRPYPVCRVPRQPSLERLEHIRVEGESVGSGAANHWSPHEADPNPPAWSQATSRFGGSERARQLDKFILG